MGVDPDRDPYGILDDVSFLDEWDAESVPEALRKAEAAPSTTPESERKRCPYCGSEQVQTKSLKREGQHRKDGKFYCSHQGCRRHFDQPADESTILMTDERADAFEWVELTDTIDPDERSELDPPFAELDEQTRTALAIFLCQPWHEAGASYREAAAFFPHSHYWIGRRVRAWREGEHRELVPDPTAEPEPITVEESSDATAVATDGGRRSRWDAYGGD